MARRWSSGSKASWPSKRDSTYQAGQRSRAWLKIKSTQSAEFVIGGYTRGKGARDTPRCAAARLLRRQGAALRRARRLRPRRGEHRDPARSAPRSSSARPRPLPRRRRCTGRRRGSGPSSWRRSASASGPRPARCGRRCSCGCARMWRPAAWRGAPAVRIPPRAARPRDAPAARAPAVRAAPAEAGEVLEQLKSPAKNLELKVAGARIKLTNLDRIYWPADAKRGNRRSPSAT